MKVLIAHSHYRSTAPSGENLVVRQEAEALRSAGHEVVAFDRYSDDLASRPALRRAAVVATSVRDRSAYRDLAAAIASSRPDVVHVHNTFPMLSPAVLDVCRDAGVPVVATLHNYKLLCASGDFFRDGRPCHDCADGSVRGGLAHGCYRGSRAATAPVVAGMLANRRRWREAVSAYVFISAAQRDLMRGLALPEDRVFVKHNLVPPLADRPRDERSPLVVYLGRLDAAKGVAQLQAAWDAFRTARPGAALRLAIAGGGPLQESVTSWAAVRPEVEWHGRLDRSELASLLGRARAAVVPSAWEETFGLVAVEAMSLGVAPIVPAHGALAEIVEDGRTGVCYPPGDTAALARALAEVDADPERFLDLGRSGRERYLEEFHPERGVERLLEVYHFAMSHPVVRSGGRP